MKRIFLDANVLFTALYRSAGLAAQLVKHHKSLSLQFVNSEYAWREAEFNLQKKKPESLSGRKKILGPVLIQSIAIQENFNPLKLPIDDIPIFQGTLLNRCTHLLTGNLNHFGKWMNKPDKTLGLVIQTVRQFADGL